MTCLRFRSSGKLVNMVVETVNLVVEFDKGGGPGDRRDD
jgi:hypothetical protein